MVGEGVGSDVATCVLSMAVNGVVRESVEDDGWLGAVWPLPSMSER